MRSPEPPTGRYNQAALDADRDQPGIPLIHYEYPGEIEDTDPERFEEWLDAVCPEPWWVRAWNWLRGFG